MSDSNASTPSRSFIRVLVAARYPIVRMGIRHVLAPIPNIEIAGEVPTERAAWAACLLYPDVVLLDIDAVGSLPQQLLHDLHRQAPDCRIIILTERTVEEPLLELLRDGAAGILGKTAPTDAIANCIQAVYGGWAWIPASLVATAVRQIPAPRKTQSPRRRRSLDRTACSPPVPFPLEARLCSAERTPIVSSQVQIWDVVNTPAEIRALVPDAAENGWVAFVPRDVLDDDIVHLLRYGTHAIKPATMIPLPDGSVLFTGGGDTS